MKSNVRSFLASHLANPIHGDRDWSLIHDLLIFTGSLGLYIRTLSPTVYTFDSAELIAGAYSLGIVHPTGYPLYLMLAKLFTLLIPFGDIAYRVNLFSAFCAALSLVVLRRVALMITGSASIALLVCALLGASYLFWSAAVVAEVYTLHVLFLNSTLWLALRWRATGSAGLFVTLGLVTGLSFGNHMSAVLVVPGLAYLVWESMKRDRVPVPRLSIWIKAGLAGLIGMLTYLYLPIRYAANPSLNYATLLGVDLSTLKGIFNMVRGAMFANLMFGYPLSEIPQEIWRFLQLLWLAFLGVGPVLAIVGFIDMWRRDRPLVLTLSLVFAANIIFYINYRVLDKDTMFLPAIVITTLWMASGIRGMQDRLAAGLPRRAVSWAAGVLLIIMLFLNFPRVDLSDNWITRQYAEDVFQQAPHEAFIIGGWIDIVPLRYLQIVENQRQDITLYDYGLYLLGREFGLQEDGISQQDAWRISHNEIRQVVANQIALGRPVFSLGENAILEPTYTLAPISEWLYAVMPIGYERLRP